MKEFVKKIFNFWRCRYLKSTRLKYYSCFMALILTFFTILFIGTFLMIIKSIISERNNRPDYKKNPHNYKKTYREGFFGTYVDYTER